MQPEIRGSTKRLLGGDTDDSFRKRPVATNVVAWTIWWLQKGLAGCKRGVAGKRRTKAPPFSPVHFSTGRERAEILKEQNEGDLFGPHRTRFGKSHVGASMMCRRLKKCIV